MRVFITCDSYWEAKIDKVLNDLYKTGYTKFFDEQNYGSSIDGIGIFLMCQDPSLNLKRRIRHSKKHKMIYLDIMLDLPQFMKIDQRERQKIVAEKIIEEVAPIIAKYKLKDFDLPLFKTHLAEWMNKMIR